LRLIQKEIQNPYGVTLSKEEYILDANGNCQTQKCHVYHETTFDRTLTITKTYDSLNRVLTILEEEDKTTSYTYTPSGKLSSTKKPDHTLLTYTYDLFGNNTQLLSSDGTIHYTYTYTPNGHLLTSHDHIHNTTTTRNLDPDGHILQETLANGLTIHNTYDNQGRRTQLTLPTNTTIEYTYTPLHLHQVNSHGLTTSYTYDPAGNLQMRGNINYTYDRQNRPTSLTTNHFTQTLTYDPRGNIIEMEKEHLNHHLTYDGLCQLIKERNNTYTYDNYYNRRSKNDTPYHTNNNHSLTSHGDTTYTYDANGNPLTASNTTYTYDALDRLTSVQTPTSHTTYTYDSLHRRMTKKNQTTHHKYLYDGQKEIGAYTPHNTPLEERILGHSERDTILVILNDKKYHAIQDLQGNTVRLINPTETQDYHYNAYSEENPTSNLTPWRYSSKRHDPETNLIYFGHRYYNPETGRFLTPDPATHTDSANLYAYTFNNPLSYFDAFGLNSTPTFPSITFGEPPKSEQMKFIPFERNIERIHQFNRGLEGMPSFYRPPFPYKERSSIFDLKRPEQTDRHILYVNGVFNEFKDARQSATYLSDLAGGNNVHGLHCATFGKLDLQHAQLLLNYHRTEPVDMLTNYINDYFQNSSSTATMLLITHSNGNSVGRNGLMRAPEEYRKRIFVLSLSQSTDINPNLCAGIRKYASKDDWVPNLDIKNTKQRKQNLTRLPSHPDANHGLDHSVDSPTLKPHIQRHMITYLESGCLE